MTVEPLPHEEFGDAELQILIADFQEARDDER